MFGPSQTEFDQLKKMVQSQSETIDALKVFLKVHTELNQDFYGFNPPPRIKMVLNRS